MNNNLIAIDAVLGQFNIGINLQGLWINSQAYVAGQSVIDGLTAHIWSCAISHTSAASPTTFLTDRTNNPTFWVDITNPAIPAAQSAINSAASAVTAAASQTAAAASATAAATSAATNAAGLAPVIAQAAENVGRNLFHNGEFSVQQRGVGAVTANAYTADRWVQTPVTDTCSTTIAALVDADRTAIGDEAALWTLKSVVTGTAGAGSFTAMEQRLEGVQRYGGKTLTVSFWAKAATGTPSIGVGAYQSFGSGGSPSANVNVTALPVVLSTVWTRYTVTLTIPTTIGKTLGTAGDFLAIRLWYSSGATNNTLAGGIGVQSPTISLWGMQCEVGNAATTFEKLTAATQLSQCQRFYQIGSFQKQSYNATAANDNSVIVLQPMRILPPTTTFSPTSNINCGSFSLSGLTASALGFTTAVTSLGSFFAALTWTASADL